MPIRGPVNKRDFASDNSSPLPQEEPPFQADEKPAALPALLPSSHSFSTKAWKPFTPANLSNMYIPHQIPETFSLPNPRVWDNRWLSIHGNKFLFCKM
jgi:hypothetical protein